MIDRTNNKILNVENERLEKLYQVLEYEPGKNMGDVKSEFFEFIHYNGYVYRFNESGFVDKQKEEIIKPLSEEENSLE